MSTRNRILELIESRRATSAPDLARALQVTPANIRHHLAQLSADGLIVKSGERHAGGRGRPVSVYELVDRRDNFPILTGLLLEALAENSPPEDTWLYEVAGKLAGEPPDATRHITQRLVEAMQRLDALHYRPSWEAHPGAPEVVFESCPYAEVIDAHPELCRLDAFLLKILTGKTCRQTSKLEPTREGVRICRFTVG